MQEKNDITAEVEALGRVGALLGAASTGECDKILALIAGGVNPNAADYDKRTALHIACADGRSEAVTVLLDKGARADVVDRFQCSPLDEAIINHHIGIATMLKERVPGLTTHATEKIEAQLISAASSGDLKTVNALIGLQVNANCHDYDLRTPLHLAVSNSHPSVVEALLKGGANPRIQDRWGNSPVSDAIRHGHSDDNRVRARAGRWRRRGSGEGKWGGCSSKKWEGCSSKKWEGCSSKLSPPPSTHALEHAQTCAHIYTHHTLPLPTPLPAA